MPMRTRTIDSQHDNILKPVLEKNRATADLAQMSLHEGAALTGSQAKMLAMQNKRGNQYVLRMMANGAFPIARVQRDEDSSDEEQAPDSSNSMIGDAANFVGDLLGVKEIPGKAKQVVDKTRQGVNQGIDWVTDKVRGGAHQVEEWLED